MGDHVIRVHVPPSKSVTHRALVLAALADGRTTIDSPLLADDTRATLRALRALGVAVDEAGGGGSGPARDSSGRRSGPGTAPAPPPEPGGGGALEVTGRDGRLEAPEAPLDLAGAGTAMRLLTAAATLARGSVVLDGDPRLRERPIGPLLDALRALGADVASLQADGFPPVVVRGTGRPLRGGAVRIEGALSSQFASAALLVAPFAETAVSIELAPPLVSIPYVDMTVGLMGRFGVDVGVEVGAEVGAKGGAETRPRRYGIVAGQRYRARRLSVPPDASSAGYFFAAAAILGTCVEVADLAPDDSQPDLALLAHLASLGCRVERTGAGTRVTGPSGDGGTTRPRGPLTPGARTAGTRPGRSSTGADVVHPRFPPFDLDLGATPDLVPTLAVIALFADGVSTLRNVGHLRFKESDRLSALAAELRKVGAEVEEGRASLRIAPAALHGAVIDTYRDHRIAMAFGVASLAIPEIRITDPGCVAKSFPTFWETLAPLAAAGA